MSDISRISRKLDDIANRRYMEGQMESALLDIKGWVNVYPLKSEANSEENKRWYERGYGPKWRRKDGSIGGRNTSQVLRTSWAHQVMNNGMNGKVGTRVTYAPYVQKRDKQAWFHRNRGWRTAEGAIETRGPRVMRRLTLAVHTILSR